MISRDAFAIFRRDGRELLRDRRTLFVNLVLPVLIYPVLVLFLLQVAQLTGARPVDEAVVLAVDLPVALGASLAEKPASSASPAAGLARGMGAAREAVTVRPISGDSPWQAHAAALAETEAPATARAAALADLRAAQATAALVLLAQPHADGRQRLVVIADDASPRHDAARAACDRAANQWKRRLAEDRLTAAGLPTTLMDPVQVLHSGTATVAETVRTRIAGAVPILLVLMAVVGAFWPAVDLMAGERERGTLETLMSSPIRRRDIFLGKLLVVCCAGLASVLLNLLSLGLTAGLLAGQLGASGLDLGNLVGMGLGTLLLCAVALLPVVVTLGAVSLALAGLAHSAKEAQNYLAPLVIGVQMAALPALLPHAGPSPVLDLVPVTGAVLALKEALQAPTVPWGHLALTTATSVALAAVMVAWASRLMDDERFRYPGLVRAGWGRFRRWGPTPTAPSGVEALGVYALAVAGMALGAKLLIDAGPVAQVVGPLLLFIALPALLHGWLGAYRPAALHLGRPQPRHLFAGLALVPLGLALSLGLGALQSVWAPKAELSGVEEQVMRIVSQIEATGGLPLVLLCLAVAPGVCEEILCRGTLLSGFRRVLGPAGAVVLSAFLFAALHMSPWRFVPQMALGILLAVIVLRTGTIWPAVILHAGHNGILVAASILHTRDPFKGWLPLLEAQMPLLAATFAGLVLVATWSAWRLTTRST